MATEYGLVLPDQFPPIGQVLQQGMGIQQRQNEQIGDLYQQRLKQQQENANANLSYLNKETDELSKYKTGIEAINGKASEEIDKIFQDFTKIASQASPQQFQGALMQRLGQVGQWYGAANTAYENMQKGIEAYTKDVPNVDPVALRNIGMNKIASTFIDPKSGETKPYELLPKNFNPLEDLKDRDVVALSTTDPSPFYDYFKKFEKTPVGGKDFVSKKGFVEKFNWKGSQLGDLTEVEVDENGKPKQMVLKYETVPGMTDENGKPLKIMKEDVFSQLYNTAGIGNSMDKLWLDNQQRVRMEWAKKNKRLPSEQENELLKKNFIYNEAQKSIPSALLTEEGSVVPKPPSINIYNQAQNSPAAQWVNDMYTAAASGNDEYVKGIASQLFSGMGKNEFEGQAFYLTGDQTGTGKPAIQINYKGAIKGKDIFGRDTEEIGRDYERIYLDDPNIKTKLAGLYQQVMGATGKVEDANFYKNQQPIINKQATPQSKKSSSSNVPSFLKKN